MAVESRIGSGSPEPWYRIHALSADSAGGTAAADYAAVLPAALHAARCRRRFIVGWLSRGGSAPLELITNAGPLPAAHAGPLPAADPGPLPDGSAGTVTAAVDMLFPWGARGTVISDDVLAQLNELVWSPCPGRRVAAAVSVAGGDKAAQQSWPADGRTPPTLFESALQALVGRAFGWLVVAEPTDRLQAETTQLRNELTVLRRYDDEQSRFEASRAEQRLAELDTFGEAGLWDVRVLVGAANEQELELIVPLLVGSAELGAHPYRLRCLADAPRAGDALGFADALGARLTDRADGSAVPFCATAGVLAALTGLPRHEVPGVRLIRAGYFDVTADERRPGPGVDLGSILDGRDRAVGSFSVPLATLNRHALVTGATGSGKSQTVRHLLEQLTLAGIGWLAVEPVKSEYGVMASRLATAKSAPHREVTLINPADPESVPLSINPLAPESGYPVQGHIDMVRALFLAAFDAQEPFPQIMAQALQRVYEHCGWDPQTGGGRADRQTPPAAPTLAQLQRAALAVIEDVGYGRELQADMRGFIDVRLRSLRTGSAGRFFEGGHPADVRALLEHNVVLALEDVANDEDKAFVIGALVIRIVEHLRLRSRSAPAEGLRHVIVLEEAHRLLRAGRDGASAHAVELFAGLLAEIRAYGEGIVVAEQIPAKLVPDVVKNTALKVLHRLPAADDRQLVGAGMNLDEHQSRQVVSLRPGEAVAFADGMDRPMRIRVPYGGDRERARVADSDVLAGTGCVRGAAAPLLLGRRSAACGPVCQSARPCMLVQIREADLLARSGRDAWLRVWSEVHVLAHLVNRPRPRVPVPLRIRWGELPERLRQCALGTAVDDAVQRRSDALRPSFDPAALSKACAASAVELLDGGNDAGSMPGTMFLIPQLQSLTELERSGWQDRPAADPFMNVPGDRLIAWTALLGEDDQRSFIGDVAAVAIGVRHGDQLRQVAVEMGVASWLQTVLSWPRRFIVGADEPAALPVSDTDLVAG